MKRDAVISACEKYRYSLTRHWGSGTNTVAFVMLNPSTADASVDDPTIRRCIRYATDWGFDGLEVVNLFAYRATDPQELKHVSDPVGPLNRQYLLSAHASSPWMICAWGNHGGSQAKEFGKLFRPESFGVMRCLGVNKNGSPKHPLYVRADVTPIEFRP